MLFTRKSRSRRLIPVLAAASLLGACNSVLEVDNPATIETTEVTDILFVPELVQIPVARLQAIYDDAAFYGAWLTDEAVSGHNFVQNRQVDLRQIDQTSSESYTLYQGLQYARFTSDDAANRLTTLLADSASRDLGLARVRAYSALSYVLMGDYLCEAPVDPTQDAITSDSLYRIATTRAAQAIATANAYKAAGGNAARADSILNLARVSAARAYLNLRDNARAAEFAAQVPLSFRLLSVYNETQVTNVFFGATTGGNQTIGVDARFRNLNDVRVRHGATPAPVHDQRTVLFTPFQSPAFTGYNPATPAGFTRSTGIIISSGLEARYILAEAQGLTPANLAFVMERRAAGGAASVVVPLPASPTEAQYRAALREQKSRDFFLGGYRLGDLRRYKRTGQGDFFPTGPHPTAGYGNYGTSECFIPNIAESVGNPNYTG